MRRFQRQVRYLLWDRAQIEEGRNGGNSSTERPRKDGGLRLIQRESLMKEQAVRIATHARQEDLFYGNRQQLGSSCWRAERRGD